MQTAVSGTQKILVIGADRKSSGQKGARMAKNRLHGKELDTAGRITYSILHIRNEGEVWDFNPMVMWPMNLKSEMCK